MSNGLLTRERGRSARPAGPPAMDPRVRARRVSVARDQGRRRLRRLVALLVVVVLVGAAVAAVRSPLLDVDRVVIKGADRVDPAAVRASAVPLGRAMASVDEDAVARRLEAQPWIESARVTRAWPSTVVVAITERVPAAVVRSSGSETDAVLVDRHGVVLGPVPDGAQTALPTVLVARPPRPGREVSGRAQRIIATVRGLDPALRRQVALGTTRRDGVRLVLDDDITVVLGDPNRLAAKSDAVLALLAQADRETIHTIDVSVPGSAALTRNEQAGA